MKPGKGAIRLVWSAERGSTAATPSQEPFATGIKPHLFGNGFGLTFEVVVVQRQDLRRLLDSKFAGDSLAASVVGMVGNILNWSEDVRCLTCHRPLAGDGFSIALMMFDRSDFAANDFAMVCHECETDREAIIDRIDRSLRLISPAWSRIRASEEKA